MCSWSQIQRIRNKGKSDVKVMGNTVKTCKLSLFDQFYLCLTKLRLGTLSEKLAEDFIISVSTVSRVFLSWVYFLYFLSWVSQAHISSTSHFSNDFLLDI